MSCTCSLNERICSNTAQGFYDVAKDAMIEPAHTGISYSFTDDGFFEEAYFRAISNREPITNESDMGAKD